MHWTPQAWSWRQDDGTFHVRRDGDKWLAYLETNDGRTVVVGRFEESGFAKHACAWLPKQKVGA